MKDLEIINGNCLNYITRIVSTVAQCIFEGDEQKLRTAIFTSID